MKRNPYAMLGLAAGVLVLIGCTMLQWLDGGTTEGTAHPSSQVAAPRTTPTWTASPDRENAPASAGSQL